MKAKRPIDLPQPLSPNGIKKTAPKTKTNLTSNSGTALAGWFDDPFDEALSHWPEDLPVPPSTPTQSTTGQLVQIFDTVKMKTARDEQERKSNLYKNLQRILNAIEANAGQLPLSLLPETLFQQFDNLAQQFPNFTEVIAFYRAQCALAAITTPAVFAATPLLIAGPPGIGKTAFCSALASALDTHFECIGLAGMTAGFVLGGMSSSWADGRPGKVVEALAYGSKANPIIMLDEIDKSGGDKRYDTLGALYPLLEKHTSKNFVDEGLEVAVDCSHIHWVATANTLETIPDPIHSRFTVIDVPAPNHHQLSAVLCSVYASIRRQHPWGPRFSPSLSQSVINKIVQTPLNPRGLRLELIASCGRAALRKKTGNGLYKLKPEDFEPRAQRQAKRSIGFIQSQ